MQRTSQVAKDRELNLQIKKLHKKLKRERQQESFLCSGRCLTQPNGSIHMLVHSLTLSHTMDRLDTCGELIYSAASQAMTKFL